MAKQKFGSEVKVRNAEFKRKSYMSRKMRFYLLILFPIGLGVSFILVVLTSLSSDIAISAGVIIPIAASWLLAEIETQKFFKEKS